MLFIKIWHKRVKKGSESKLNPLLTLISFSYTWLY